MFCKFEWRTTAPIDTVTVSHIAIYWKVEIIVNSIFWLSSLSFGSDWHNTEAVAQRRSVKKVFLETSQNLQENTCAPLRTPFLIEHLRWLAASDNNTSTSSSFHNIWIQMHLQWWCPQQMSLTPLFWNRITSNKR